MGINRKQNGNISSADFGKIFSHSLGVTASRVILATHERIDEKK